MPTFFIAIGWRVSSSCALADKSAANAAAVAVARSKVRVFPSAIAGMIVNAFFIVNAAPIILWYNCGAAGG